MYYSNGDRELGNYHEDKLVGICVTLTKDGEVRVKKY